MKERYTLVTGATGAIGKEIVRELLRQGEPVILACRNEEKGQALITQLRKSFPSGKMLYLQLDLSKEKSVLEAANTLRDVELKGLINNAGVMCRRYARLVSGLETTIAVNYVFTAMLTQLLLPRIQNGGVVVFTTSLTRFLWRHQESRFPEKVECHDLHQLKKDFVPEVKEGDFTQLGTYGLSKRLVTDYAWWLSKKVADKGIRVNCADPGVVNTGMITMHRWYDRLADLLFRPFIRSPRKGAQPAIRAYRSLSSGYIFTRYRKRKH